MSRDELIDALVARAQGLGWSGVEVDDAGTSVLVLLSAEGAAEQMVEGALHQVPGLLAALGGPEEYPAAEEYDIDPDLLPHIRFEEDSAAETAPEPEPEPEALAEDPEPAYKADEGLDLAQAFNAAVQTGWQVSGVGLHTGPFTREFTSEGKAQAFAAKCRAAAASPKYAGTIQVAPA